MPGKIIGPSWEQLSDGWQDWAKEKDRAIVSTGGSHATASRIAIMEAAVRQQIERCAGRKAALSADCIQKEKNIRETDYFFVIEITDVPENMRAQLETDIYETVDPLS